MSANLKPDAIDRKNLGGKRGEICFAIVNPLRALFGETVLILEQVSRIWEYLRYRRGSRLGATRSIASLPLPK